MQVPMEITSRDFPLTPAIEDFIRKRAEKLEKYFSRITSCRVVVETPHKHQKKGKEFNIRIDITVPGHEYVIKRKPHEDIYVALRDAFDAAARVVEEHSQKIRGDVKSHEEAPEGKVKSLYPTEDYGFLETLDGTEVYFHKNAVANDAYASLEIGMKVRYSPEMGEKGPQATVVTPID